jgi:hypothetical protein
VVGGADAAAAPLAFADDDIGLAYYRRKATGRDPATVRTYEGLGHLPGGPARDRLLADIHDS